MKTKVLSRLDRESVAILTFERPTKLNALNYELVDSIVHALERIEEEKQGLRRAERWCPPLFCDKGSTILLRHGNESDSCRCAWSPILFKDW